MWKIVAILGLALSIGIGTAFAQNGQKKKEGPAKHRQSVEDVFKAKDKDQDGKLSKEEFIGNVKDPERIKELEKRFKAIDTNNDSNITLDELKAFWDKQGQGAGKQHGKRLPPQKSTV